MNRRNWLKQLRKLLFAAPVLALGKSIQAAPELGEVPDKFTYRGYEIRWTGWKDSPHTVNLFGQWVAWSLKQEEFDREGGFYASSAGVSSHFYKSDMFNLVLTDERNYIDLDNVDRDGPRVRKETLDRLIKLLHAEGL